MTCRHCGGRPLIKALLSKEGEEKIGLVNHDLANRALKERLKVKLNSESGWQITMVWTPHTFWEKDLEHANEWVLLRQILDIELEG